MIAAESLSKRYDGVPVVDDVTFTCQRGTVTGFLGPNGAGKSTTLRMITGLTRPDNGHATVAGVPFVALPNPSRVVGTLLDASAMHPGRSGRNTLAVAAHMAAVPQARVDEVLGTVGLSAAAADKRVGTYSLGMRQRLGIAQTLIGHPEVLILDEPANGLDPEGIAWMRELLPRLRRPGRHRAAVQPPARRSRSHRRPPRRDPRRPRRRRRAPRRPAHHHRPWWPARPTNRALRRAHRRRDVVHRHGTTARSRSTPPWCHRRTVASVAAQAGVLLVELRAADRTGLEQLFFSLTTSPATDTDLEEVSR